jgi:predicted short-subunit dehydrogenase-like oxidoreductase (DUF2520 family)
VHDPTQRAFALVGPGRAGTTIATVLVSRGWRAVAVSGRRADAPSTLRVAASLGARACDVVDVGRGAELVIVATPDNAIAATAAALAPGLRADALVVHLSGACSVAELDKLAVARADVRLGSLHPLQTIPSVDAGVERLGGSWCAVDGPNDVERLARSLGMLPFRVEASDRVRYHAAATIAANHVVATLGQAARLAESAGVPWQALLPLVRASIENIDTLGPAGALTGPVARGDAETVARHLDALPESERDAYRSGAREALRLADLDESRARALRSILESTSDDR